MPLGHPSAPLSAEQLAEMEYTGPISIFGFPRRAFAPGKSVALWEAVKFEVYLAGKKIGTAKTPYQAWGIIRAKSGVKEVPSDGTPYDGTEIVL